MINPLSDDQLKHIQDMHTARRNELTKLFSGYKKNIEIIQSVSYRDLEEAILGLNLHSDEDPKIGDAVIVVTGNHAGLVGVINNLATNSHYGIEADNDFEYVATGDVRKLKVQAEGVSK